MLTAVAAIAVIDTSPSRDSGFSFDAAMFLLCLGLPVSQGVAKGKARVVTSLQEADEIQVSL